jgi:PAS domain S-box-containing protein
MADTNNKNIDKKKQLFLLSITFIILCGSGWLFFKTQKTQIREEKSLELAAIGNLKATQIEEWITERKAEGYYFHNNEYFKTVVKDFIKAPSISGNRMKLTKWLLPFMNGHEYMVAYIITPDKKVYGFSNKSLTEQNLDEIFKFDHLNLDISDHIVKMSDAFQTAKNNNVYIDMLTKLKEDENPKRLLAYLLFRMDPTVELFKSLKEWPTPSKTSETYIIRFEKNNAFYLNELRHLKNSSFNYRIPINKENFIGIRVASGDTGTIEGRDYRGVKVLANIHRIHHAKWIMIAKVDQSEIYSQINYLAVLITLFVILLFSITVFLLLFINRNAISKTYKQLYEKELENNVLKQQYDYLMQSANDIIFIYNTLGSIISANESAVMEYGYSQKELTGMNIEDLHLPENKSTVKKNIQRITELGRLRFETKNVRKDGTELIIEASSRLITLSKETLILGIIRNITEQKKAQEDLIVAKKRAEESDNLKTFFINNLSHEIRTPLNAIIGFSKLLYDEEISIEEKNKFIKIIDKSSTELLNNFSNIIDISQIETKQLKINFSTVAISTILSQIESFLNNQIDLADKSDLKTQINVSSKIISDSIVVDGERLMQILEHLISNAIKFTKAGSIIIDCNSDGNEIVFSIKDTGIGISTSQQDYIFDRFRKGNESLNTSERGTGLGLSISKGLARLMGGDVWVESLIGTGSTFYLELPYYGNDYPKMVLNKISDKNKLKKPVILIAEDEMYNMLYFQEVLKHYNVELLDAHDGIEALHVLEKRHDVDIVLLDLKMPGMGGYEVLRQAKPIYPSLIFIAQTAYAMFDDRIKCLNAGFDDYIPKPITQTDLLNIINTHLSIPLIQKDYSDN